jgi:predicted metalloprotease
MKWEGREESQNVEDRRGLGKKAAIGGGAGILLLLIALALGMDPQKIMQLVGPGVQPQDAGQRQPADPAEEKMASFSKVIFRDTEEVWDELFRKMGKQYQKPTLVLFSDLVESACGSADSAVGPFYCPGDSRVYIDLSFYRDMERQLQAPGEFARAYVIAH